MKLLILILLSAVLSAVDPRITAQIYERLLGAVFTEAQIAVYAADPEYHTIFDHSKKVLFSGSPKVVLAKNTEEIPAGNILPVFAGSYHLLAADPNAIGAFFWEKNYPKVIFVRSRLERFGLTLSPEFSKYLIEQP